jgi:hypothetical protein
MFAEGLLLLIIIRKFTETFSRLEQADKHKTEFLCRMSHELRYYITTDLNRPWYKDTLRLCNILIFE